MDSPDSQQITYNFHLKVTYNHNNLDPCSQKCLIPREKFPKGVAPGNLCICTLDSQDYVCFLYPMNNQFPLEFCAIDNCVRTRNGLDRVNSQDNILSSITILGSATQAFRKLNVKLHLNNLVFERFQGITRSKLVQTARSFLTLYHFTGKSVIDVYHEAKSFGLESIEILSGSGESRVGCISDETEFKVDDIHFIGSAARIEANEIAGMEGVVYQLNQIAKECASRERILALGVTPSFNILVAGTTGCGKTSVCHNFILNNQCNLFEINSSDIIKPLPGETEEELRNLFDNAKVFVKSFQPKGLTIIFIENIDLLCPAEVSISTDKSHMARISGQLLALLDDLHRNDDGIMVLGTTTNLELVSTAVRRPGRFENEILIHSPSERQREQILMSILTRESNQLEEVHSQDLAKWIACRTPGYVGADLALLVNSVSRQIWAMHPKADGSNQHSIDDLKEYYTDSLKMIKPTSLRGTDVSVISCDLTFDQIGGLDGLKKSLHTLILSPIKNPEAFHRFGLQPPKGILLYGPPGCAKTMIAKCLANEANMTFISTSGAEVYSPYVGDAEKFILKIFNTARKNAPCLVFFDEIDALVGCRQKGNNSSEVQSRVLSALLTEMDGIGMKVQSADASPNSQILIVGATNRPDVIDNALMRPGRFDRLIHVPPPDFETRLKILVAYKNKMPFAENVDIENIASLTESFSGADLCNLCNEAALQAITRYLDADAVTAKDFQHVLKEMSPSLTKDQIDWYMNFERQHVCLRR